MLSPVSYFLQGATHLTVPFKGAHNATLSIARLAGLVMWTMTGKQHAALA